MPDTHGFEMVMAVGMGIVRRRVQAVLEKIGVRGEGRISRGPDAGAAAGFEPFVATCGEFQVVPGSVGLEMAPGENAVGVSLAATLRMTLAPGSAPGGAPTLFEMRATVGITAPVGAIPGPDQPLGLVFDGLPRRAVTVSVTADDPEGAVRLQLLREYLHARWRDPTIARTVTVQGINCGYFTADAFLQTFDHPEDAAYRISTTAQGEDHVKISIPVHLRLDNITAAIGISPLFPMGVVTRVAIMVPLISGADRVTARLASAVVALEPVDLPGATACLTGAPWGGEGERYRHNRREGLLFGFDLEGLLKRHLLIYGRDLVADIGDIPWAVPTVAALEAFIGEQVHGALLKRGGLELWRPGDGEAFPDVRPCVLPGALGVAINPGAGADEEKVATVRLASRGVAIALDGAVLDRILAEMLGRPPARGGFGLSPRTFPRMGGYRCTVRALKWALGGDAIRFTGDVKVHDLCCGADADCSFWVEIGLRWTGPDGAGPQRLEPYLIDQEVDFSWWAGLTAVLGGLVAALMAVVWRAMPLVTDRIVRAVGAVVEPGASRAYRMDAFPVTLHRRVDIDSGGLLVTGELRERWAHPGAGGLPGASAKTDAGATSLSVQFS